MYLPEIAVEKIFSFLTFDEIAKNRIVCRKFNEIGKKMLSRGFVQLEKRHSGIYKKVKSLLPRRESERRSHPLARHCDILQAVETRISMLNMTYVKFMENNLLCFIPGKVLDEMRTVLCLVESDQTPPRTHQLLQELRDLSSMAMEHFDEHILPKVKEQVDRRSALSYGSVASSSKTPRLILSHQSLSNEIHKVKKQSKTHKHHISYLTQSTQKLFQKLRKQNMRIKAQSLKIREQEKKIQEQNTKIQDQEATLADFKKHIEEWDQKYKDLTAELVRAREDILTATSQRSPTAPTHNAATARCFKTNIKPRTSQVLPKTYSSNLNFDLDRKRKSSLIPEIPLKRNRAPESDVKEALNLKIPDLLNFRNDINKTDVKEAEPSNSRFTKSDMESIIETILSNPFNCIKNRKRKMAEDIDLE